MRSYVVLVFSSQYNSQEEETMSTTQFRVLGPKAHKRGVDMYYLPRYCSSFHLLHSVIRTYRSRRVNTGGIPYYLHYIPTDLRRVGDYKF